MQPAVATVGDPRRAERWLWVVIGAGVLIVIAAATRDGQANLILGVLVAGLVVASYQRFLLAWRTMLGVILLVILFIPIRRYTVAGNLPIELEPYRIVIALVLACWFCALAADPEGIKWRKTGLEAPIGVLLLVMVASMMVNLGAVNRAGMLVVKNFTFFMSYILVVYFIASAVRSQRDLLLLLRILVGGSTLVAVASLFEWRTTTNLFNWYSHVMPFLHYVDEGAAQARGSGVRARGSAQHPIALSAALVMMVPLALYLYFRARHRIWLVCAAFLTLGCLSTGSRTGTTMLIAVFVSFICIRPRQTLRLTPWLIPMLVVIQVVMPGTLGTMRSMLNPAYLMREQSYNEGTTAGRVADLGPALDRWATQPFLGWGFGTKMADPNAKAGGETQILDDQWLGSLLEIGALGVLALLWLWVRAIRRLTAVARSAPGDEGWLPTAIASSIVAFAVGMLTFDAFAFIQVTFFAFIMLGFTAVIAPAPQVPHPAVARVKAARKRRRRRRRGHAQPVTT